MWLIVCLIIIALAAWPPLQLRFFRRAQVTTSLDAKPGSSTLFVHLPGLNEDGLEQIRNIIEVFDGDLLTVHCNGDYGKKANAFSAHEAVEVTSAGILDALDNQNYRHVILVGTSMGGKIAYLVADILWTECVVSKVVLIDSPLGRHDFQPPLHLISPLLPLARYVPIFNLFFIIRPLEKLAMSKLVVPPKDGEIDHLTDDERTALHESVAQARLTKLAFYADQSWEILRPLKHRRGSPWAASNVVYVRSTADDDTVRPSAYDSWCKVLGFNPKHILVDGAKHCSYGQMPQRYRNVLPGAFDLLRER